jgi:hypothetical protein
MRILSGVLGAIALLTSAAQVAKADEGCDRPAPTYVVPSQTYGYTYEAPAPAPVVAPVEYRYDYTNPSYRWERERREEARRRAEAHWRWLWRERMAQRWHHEHPGNWR